MAGRLFTCADKLVDFLLEKNGSHDQSTHGSGGAAKKPPKKKPPKKRLPPPKPFSEWAAENKKPPVKKPPVKKPPVKKPPVKKPPVKKPPEETSNSGSRKLADFRSNKEVLAAGKKLIKNRKLEDPPEISKKSIKKALDSYTGEDFEAINRQLRKGADPSKIRPKPDIDNLNKIARQKLAEPVVTYRGVSGDVAKSLIGLKSGDSVEIKGMVSTTLDHRIASTFLSKSDKVAHVMLEIKAKTGVYVADKSAWSDEAELVQAHGTKYRMVGMKTATTPRGSWGKPLPTQIMQLEEI